MENFYVADFLNKVWSLALISLLVMVSACDKVDSDGPKIEDKCFGQPEMTWANGERYTLEGDRVKYVEVPPYDEKMEGGAEIKWVYLRQENGTDLIGAVKFRELLDSEIPKAANPGDFVKLLIRIDHPKWQFVPDIQNVKVEGYNEIPPEGSISPDDFEVHKGMAIQDTGINWEYYEVVLSRYMYYAINVEAQKEVECAKLDGN